MLDTDESILNYYEKDQEKEAMKLVFGLFCLSAACGCTLAFENTTSKIILGLVAAYTAYEINRFVKATSDKNKCEKDEIFTRSQSTFLTNYPDMNIDDLSLRDLKKMKKKIDKNEKEKGRFLSYSINKFNSESRL